MRHEVPLTPIDECIHAVLDVRAIRGIVQAVGSTFSNLDMNPPWDRSNHFNSTHSARNDSTHITQHKKAAHGLACEADWDYLAYSEPEARLFLSRRTISDFVVVFHVVKCKSPLKSIRSGRTIALCDTTNLHPPKTQGRHRGHGPYHHGRTRG
jgi:hypothetical protein